MNESRKPFAEFGARLKSARGALTDDNAADFADRLGIKAQTYRNYERGDRLPDFSVLCDLGRLGISLHWLFLGEKPMLRPERMDLGKPPRQ